MSEGGNSAKLGILGAFAVAWLAFGWLYAFSTYAAHGMFTTTDGWDRTHVAASYFFAFWGGFAGPLLPLIGYVIGAK